MCISTWVHTTRLASSLWHNIACSKVQQHLLQLDGLQYMSNRTPSSASYKTDQLQARAHTNTQADTVGYTLDTAFTYDMCRQVFSCTFMHLMQHHGQPWVQCDLCCLVAGYTCSVARLAPPRSSFSNSQHSVSHRRCQATHKSQAAPLQHFLCFIGS